MTRTAEKILSEAKDLPVEDKARVAEELLRSIEAPEQAEIDAAWAQEAEARLDRYHAGQTKATPAEKAIEQVRKSLRSRRT